MKIFSTLLITVYLFLSQSAYPAQPVSFLPFNASCINSETGVNTAIYQAIIPQDFYLIDAVEDDLADSEKTDASFTDAHHHDPAFTQGSIHALSVLRIPFVKLNYCVRATLLVFISSLKL